MIISGIIQLFVIGLTSALKAEITDKVFMDISIDNEPVGSIIFGLYGNRKPVTTKNFMMLSNGKRDDGTKLKNGDGKHIDYTGTKFFKINKKWGYMQGGDVDRNNGYGGTSAYYPNHRFFKDEDIEDDMHVQRYLLTMGKSDYQDPNKNESQFMIINQPIPEFDGKHVVFGEVINQEGKDLVDRIIDEAGNEYGSYDDHSLILKPYSEVMVTQSGELDREMGYDEL